MENNNRKEMETRQARHGGKVAACLSRRRYVTPMTTLVGMAYTSELMENPILPAGPSGATDEALGKRTDLDFEGFTEADDNAADDWGAGNGKWGDAASWE